MTSGGGGRAERAIMHSYNANTRVWSKLSTTIAMEEKPFAEGNFRRAFQASMTYEDRATPFVCKFAKDPATARQLYFNDVEAQMYATMWANRFNDCKPPHLISFVPCFVLELVDRPGRPLCAAEKYIAGPFRKHNNNVGAVSYAGGSSPEEQLALDTAQAFSHFTYEASSKKILICDIQGVVGQYTDPQIHTINGKGFGSGNLGITGIRAFLLRHECNSLCTATINVDPSTVFASVASAPSPLPPAVPLATSSSSSSSSSSSTSPSSSSSSSSSSTGDPPTSASPSPFPLLLSSSSTASLLPLPPPLVSATSSSALPTQSPAGRTRPGDTSIAMRSSGTAIPPAVAAVVATGSSHRKHQSQSMSPRRSGAPSLLAAAAAASATSTSSSLTTVSSASSSSSDASPAPHTPRRSTSGEGAGAGAGTIPAGSHLAPPGRGHATKDMLLDSADEDLMNSILAVTD